MKRCQKARISNDAFAHPLDVHVELFVDEAGQCLPLRVNDNQDGLFYRGIVSFGNGLEKVSVILRLSDHKQTDEYCAALTLPLAFRVADVSQLLHTNAEIGSTIPSQDGYNLQYLHCYKFHTQGEVQVKQMNRKKLPQLYSCYRSLDEKLSNIIELMTYLVGVIENNPKIFSVPLPGDVWCIEQEDSRFVGLIPGCYHTTNHIDVFLNSFIDTLFAFLFPISASVFQSEYSSRRFFEFVSAESELGKEFDYDISLCKYFDDKEWQEILICQNISEFFTFSRFLLEAEKEIRTANIVDEIAIDELSQAISNIREQITNFRDAVRFSEIKSSVPQDLMKTISSFLKNDAWMSRAKSFVNSNYRTGGDPPLLNRDNNPSIFSGKNILAQESESLSESEDLENTLVIR